MAEGQSITPSSEVEYRDIPGYEGYRAGSDGTIWTAWERYYAPGRSGVRHRIGANWRRVAVCLTRRGYCTVAIGTGGRKNRRRKYVHGLILLAFVGPRPVGTECCHYPDPSPQNNAISNLRWDTPVANSQDARNLGRLLIGERMHNAKVNAAIVRKIRQDAAGGVCQREIASRYGVSRTCVRKILARETWAHVTDEAPDAV